MKNEEGKGRKRNKEMVFVTNCSSLGEEGKDKTEYIFHSLPPFSFFFLSEIQ